MKKSKFIKQVLKSKDNTVFVNEEQVANAIEVFEKLGMLPPERLEEIPYNESVSIVTTIFVNKWEKE